MDRQPVVLRWAEVGGDAIAVAGLVGAVTFDAAISVYYLSLAVMVLGLMPVLLAFYELGGRAGLIVARGWISAAILAALAIGGAFLAFAGGVVAVDASRVEGPLAFFGVALFALYALSLGGASVLAGQWLTAIPRWLAVIAALFSAVTAIGVVLGGGNPLASGGGLGFQLLVPIWGLVIGRLFSTIRSERTGRPATQVASV